MATLDGPLTFNELVVAAIGGAFHGTINPEAKKLILDALRSGRFQETRGKVPKPWDSSGLCCVGSVVLATYREQTGDEEFKTSRVSKWLGLSDQQTHVFAAHTELLNSEQPFSETADDIEKNW